MTDLPPLWPQTITVTKLEAARRQLTVALGLWFEDGDPIAIHTLASAAYEIIHVLSKEKNRPRGLLFDSDVIEDDFRGEWNSLIKNPANFFKNAKKEKAQTLEFNPGLSELFRMFAVLGLHYCGEETSDIEGAFLVRLGYERPKFFTEAGRKLYIDRFPIEEIENLRNTPRSAFLTGWRMGVEQLRRRKP
jgi:hypothetical protein